MRERRALRFVLEALFLGALAAALTFTDVNAPAIAGLMLLGWLMVALYEWAATRERPHYGRGLPPRYYVPQVALPPPRPLEQLQTGYPTGELAGEEPTWIASPAMRAEMLAEWPVEAGTGPSPGEDTIVDDRLFIAIAEEYRVETPLDVGSAEADDDREARQVAVAEQEVVEEAEPAVVAMAKPEPVAVIAAEPLVADEPSPVVPPEVVGEPEVVEDDAEPETAARPLEQPPGPVVPVVERPARHSFDPLGGADELRRRWRRRSADQDGYAEVSARPPKPVGLPGHSRQEH